MRAYFMLAAVLAMSATGCRTSMPEEVNYPPTAPQGGEWTPTTPADRALKGCIDSLDARRNNVKSAQRFQDAMVLVGGGVSATGGVTAAALPKDNESSSQRTATTVAAAIAAAGALVALGSKLGDDPGEIRDKHARKRKHYDAGFSAYSQYDGTPMPMAIQQWVIARFTACQEELPSADIPPAPGGVSPPPPQPQ